MKAGELKKETKSESQKLLKEKREHLRKLRFDLTNSKLSNYRGIRKIKKEIARTLTVLNQKSLITKQLQRAEANGSKVKTTT